MKIIFPISSPRFTEVPLYGFFKTHNNCTCQKLSDTRFIILIDDEGKPYHSDIILPDVDKEFKIKRILKDSDISIQPLTFKDVEVGQFYQTEYGEIHQKCDYDMTQRVANREGKLSAGMQHKTNLREVIVQIFDNLDEIEIQPDYQ